MVGEADDPATPARSGEEEQEWLEEAVVLVAAAEQHLTAGRTSRSQALECLQRARSLLDTLVERGHALGEDNRARTDR